MCVADQVDSKRIIEIDWKHKLKTLKGYRQFQAMATWIFLLALLGTHWIIVEEIVAINVALNKIVTICNGDVLSSILTDGDRNTSRHVAQDGNGMCWPEYFIDVNLQTPHHINRVELFEGDPAQGISWCRWRSRMSKKYGLSEIT